jgi:spermidine/putrescine transport system substrate-binding protein
MKRLFFICLVLLPAMAMAAEKTVYIFNWSEYMPDAVLTRFEKETGIRVVYATYESNEAMYAKVKLLRSGGYDLVFPSTYFVNRMRRDGLLAPLDRNRLPHFKHLDPKLLDKPYDPGNRYSVPYLWGTTAIGVNSRFVDPTTVTSWKDLWRPEFKGKVVLSDDLRETFALALRDLGYSGNTTDPGQIETAYAHLRTLLPSVRLFSSENQKQVFLSLEATIGMIWNGEAYMAAQENPEIRYVYPKEGPLIWLDSMAIPKNAANKDHALAFIDFLCRPEIAKMISEEIGYASPNLAAIGLMDGAVRNNPTVYPPAEVLARGEFQMDVGEAILVYEKFWERLKSGQ